MIHYLSQQELKHCPNKNRRTLEPLSPCFFFLLCPSLFLQLKEKTEEANDTKEALKNIYRSYVDMKDKILQNQVKASKESLRINESTIHTKNGKTETILDEIATKTCKEVQNDKTEIDAKETALLQVIIDEDSRERFSDELSV